MALTGLVDNTKYLRSDKSQVIRGANYGNGKLVFNGRYEYQPNTVIDRFDKTTQLATTNFVSMVETPHVEVSGSVYLKTNTSYSLTVNTNATISLPNPDSRINNEILVFLDYNGGTLHYDNEATLYLIDNNILPVIKPQLEGYDFVTYENFKAQYKKIDSIEFLNTPNLSFTEGEYYDMSSCEVKIMYEDNTYRKMELNTNIARIEENKLVVSYGGKEISCEINILSSELKNELRRIVDLCLHGEINLNDLAYLKNHLKQAHLDLNMSEIRMLDKIFIDNSDYNYAFRNTKADLSISGFGLSLGDHLLKNLPRPFKDTYYLQLMNVNSNIKDIAYKYANAYDFEVVDCFKMKYSLNLVSIEPDYEQVVSYKIEDDGLYTVYCYDEDKIYKCYSEISDNYLSFITRGSGTYFILRKDTINKYDFKNIQENITSINSDPDIHMFIVEGLFVLSLFVIGLCLIVMNSILDSKEKKLWNDYKKSLQKRA